MINTILAFDFGTQSIGVAIGQRITYTARPLKAIKTKHEILNWMSIKHLLNEWQPNEIVIGLPLNMDGSEQLITIFTRKFANKINSYYGGIVKLHDERLTTVEARAKLFEQGGYQALIKNEIDSISAVIILESYLSKDLFTY